MVHKLRPPSLKSIIKPKKVVNKVAQNRKAKEARQQHRLQWLGEHGFIFAKYRFLWIVVENRPCAECGSHKKRQLDHVVPRALGGANDPSNYQVLCEGCHKRKTKRDMKLIRKMRKFKQLYQEGDNGRKETGEGQAKGSGAAPPQA